MVLNLYWVKDGFPEKEGAFKSISANVLKLSENMRVVNDLPLLHLSGIDLHCR
jgi:hypothetical protein